MANTCFGISDSCEDRGSWLNLYPHSFQKYQNTFVAEDLGWGLIK